MRLTTRLTIRRRKLCSSKPGADGLPETEIQSRRLSTLRQPDVLNQRFSRQASSWSSRTRCMLSSSPTCASSTSVGRPDMVFRPLRAFSPRLNIQTTRNCTVSPKPYSLKPKQALQPKLSRGQKFRLPGTSLLGVDLRVMPPV